MTTFNTPAAIAAELRIAIGTVRIVAGDRTDTVVDVRPSDPAKSADVKAAAAVSVSYSDVLTVASPKSRGIRTPGSVQVEIALPRGSRINGELALGRFGTEGALNDVAVHVSDGTLTVDHATAARLDAGRGDIALRHAAGSATLTTGTGNIELGVGDGVTVTAHTGMGRVHNSAGDVTATVGAAPAPVATGAVTATTGAGDITVTRPGGSVR